MKGLACIILVGMALAATTAVGAQSGAIFEAQHCNTCHKAEGSAATPSLKEIAKAYEGKESRLLNYLKGEVEAIMMPEKSNMMKRYVEKTKALSDEERKALTDFIMSYKD